MAELRLPSRTPAMDLLARLGQDNRDRFQANLLDALWDAEEASSLPQPIIELLCDWVAHAHFEDSPVVQQRRAELRSRSAVV